jgi:hypothetical protein
MEPAGVEVPIVWRGRRAKAFVPTLLADRDLTLEPATVALVARAQAAVEHGAETLPEDHAALARLLLRAEGVASSSPRQQSVAHRRRQRGWRRTSPR